MTLNHTVACTVILPDGDIVTLGSESGETPGYDLLGAFIGSEGCFGIALDCTVRNCFCCSSFSGPGSFISSVPVKPMMAFSGVRSSWLIPARNRSFAWLAFANS